MDGSLWGGCAHLKRWKLVSDRFPPGVPVSTGWDEISVVATLSCWQPLFRRSLCKVGISGSFDLR